VDNAGDAGQQHCSEKLVSTQYVFTHMVFQSKSAPCLLFQPMFAFIVTR